jgi:hypothetical protein
MVTSQRNIMDQLGPLLDELVNPPCVSRRDPQQPRHRCVEGDADEVRLYRPVKSLHVGVISSDLGTPGAQVAGCDDSDRGDDGLLNPIRYGPAMQSHLPWAPRRQQWLEAPPSFRPAVCDRDPVQFPSFITFCSDAADSTCDEPLRNASTRSSEQFVDWFKCNAGLYINGCGLESPLEAIWRALVEHDARFAPGNASPNAGFLRDEALLAIVVLTDEEDGSVRDCAHDGGFSRQGGGVCNDATDVYQVASQRWGHATSLDQRMYRYTPGSAQDPTYNLDRYYNTAAPTVANRWSRDLLSLKPFHPERIFFAAIVGVPLTLPLAGRGNAEVDWDQLLGAPSAQGPDDFYGRDSQTAIHGTQGSSGPFSMRAADAEPDCLRVIPACRGSGSVFDPLHACSPGQPVAFPSRRIVEIARRFSEFPACAGLGCHNGLVTSICGNDFTPVLRSLVERIRWRAEPYCLSPIETTQDAQGNVVASCVMHDIQPLGVSGCDPTKGLFLPVDPELRTVNLHGEWQQVCELQQIATAPASADPNTSQRPVSTEPGWYLSQRPSEDSPWCRFRVLFTDRGRPRDGHITHLECVRPTRH